MKNKALIIVSWLLLGSTNLYSQAEKFDKGGLKAVNVYMSKERLMDKDVIRVVKDSTVKEPDQPTFVKINGTSFINGTIEVKVLSRLLKNAPDYSRGFIGIAFRINDSNTKFECIYLRPLNARVEDQVRRNHSIQYFSYPDYNFERFRKEAPERYESYTDMELNKWITMRIVVKDKHARLFIDENKQPSLIVNDLKHGADSFGAIGLWVDIGTEGFFKDLKVSNQD